MATVGDSLSNLGTSLSYWAEAKDPSILRSFSLTSIPENLSRQEVADYYVQKISLNILNNLFYYVLMNFKLAVIAQQIYKHFKDGFSKDRRFAQMIHLVQACLQNAYQAIKLFKKEKSVICIKIKELRTNNH